MGGIDIGMLDRDPAHMQLENDRFFPRRLRAAILAPSEGGLDDSALWHLTRVIAPVKREILARTADAVAEEGIAPSKPAMEGLDVGIDQQLVGIEPVPVRRIVGPIDTVAVKQVWTGVRQVGMPNLVGVFRKHDPRLLVSTRAIKQAQLDLLGMRRKDGEIHSFPVPSGSQRVRTTRPNFGRWSHQRLKSGRKPLSPTLSPQAGEGGTRAAAG